MNPYSSIILNDLHHHFPELLYQPSRFTTVQEVLHYIQEVAHQDPYTRGLRAYQSSSSLPSSSLPSSSLPSSSLPSFSSASSSTRVPFSSPFFSSRSSSSSSSSSSLPHRSLRQRLAINGLMPSESLVINLLSSMLGGSASEMTSVPIVPTEEQLAANTLFHHATHAYDNNCSVCQDPIEEGQEVRTLTYCMHTFHESCIRPWFQSHATCPTCRHDVRESS